MKRTFYTIGSLVILLICAFVFVLLPAMVGNSNPNEIPALGKYDGKEIRYEQDSDFANFVQQYGQYYQSIGYQIDNSAYFNIFTAAFNATVAKMASTSAVTESGWKPSVETVNRNMRPYFTDESGNYSSKVYKQTAESTIVKMRNEIESNLTAQRFNDDYFSSASEVVGTDALYGLKESDKELDFLADYGSAKRGFNMAVFMKSSYPASEQIAYGKANADKFVKYNMSVISLEEEAEANKVLKRIDSEEISFADAVAEYSQKLYSDTEGKLNLNFGYQIETLIPDSDAVSVVKALKTGEKTGVIKTNSGYAIFKADGEPEQPDFESDTMVSSVYSYLTSYETSRIENYFIEQANAFIKDAQNKDFNEACVEASASYVEITPFPLNYGNVEITDTLDTSLYGLTNASTNENFLTTAFTLKMNEFSQPFVLDSNVVVLQYTKEEIPEETPAVFGNLSDLDQQASSDVILASPKLENNLFDVYFNYIMK